MDLFDRSLPYLTADLTGTGGVIKAEPEDFVVEEIPAYEPCGQGEHLFLWIEKRNVTADGLVRHVAHTLGVDPREIGTAGLKDTRAVTRQYVSVPARAEAAVSTIDTADIKVLRAARHGNKLKTGHARGNRFEVRVRGAGAEAAAQARLVLEALATRGVPNYFGPQRFGRGGETLAAGLTVLRGERSSLIGRAPPGRRGFLLRLAISSTQSAVFNHYLATRMADGLLHTVLAGEIMQVVASGGPFWVDDVAREQARFAAREVVPAGPIFGPKMRDARGEAAAREAAALTACGLTRDQFANLGKNALGTRRANVVFLEQIAVTERADGFELRFALPRGSYATVVLREVTKSDGTVTPEGLDD